PQHARGRSPGRRVRQRPGRLSPPVRGRRPLPHAPPRALSLRRQQPSRRQHHRPSRLQRGAGDPGRPRPRRRLDARADRRAASHLTVVPAHSASKTRVNALMLGTHIPEPVVMGPRLRGDDSNKFAAKMTRDSKRAQSMAGETVAAIVEAHRSGAASPEATIARVYARIRAHDDPAIFIALRDEADTLAEAKALAAERNRDRALADRPLFGVPVAVKDNIDVCGLPPTAACPAFAYIPDADAA